MGKISKAELSNGLRAEIESKLKKDEFDEHKAEYAIQTATGTANVITVITGGDFKYSQGNKISFKAISNSTGAVTVNIDNKGNKTLKKIDGTNATVKANKVYEIFYSVGDDCFFLLASAEGDAVAENVLAGKYFSNDDDTGMLGTMPNRGSPSQTLTTQGGQYNIPDGYFSGGSVKAQLSNLTAGNIKDGVNVGGVVGNYSPKPIIKRSSSSIRLNPDTLVEVPFVGKLDGVFVTHESTTGTLSGSSIYLASSSSIYLGQRTLNIEILPNKVVFSGKSGDSSQYSSGFQYCIVST